MDSAFYKRLDRLYAEDARKVEDFLRRELVGFEVSGDQPGLVAVHNELGSLYRGQGRYGESVLIDVIGLNYSYFNDKGESGNLLIEDVRVNPLKFYINLGSYAPES